MSIEWVNGAIEEIRAWGRSNGVVVDADEIRLLCDYASDYLDVKELADFAPVTFERLLLDIYPRKVIAPPESAAETVAASRTLVDFLLDSGEIGTKMAARMRAKIDEIAPEMPAALADTTKFGMAKSMFGAMGADALEAGTPYVATDDLVAAPRRPRSDDGAGDCDCPACAPLPAVRLAPPQEVAQGAREAGLLREAQLLVAWMLEGGRVPTVKGTLRVRDAARAARELGLTAPALAWDAALAIGLAEVSGRALTAPRGTEPLPDRDDETVLDLWAGVVAFLTGGSEADVTGFAPVDRELYGVHDMLYRAQAPLEVAALREYLEDTWAGTALRRARSWTRASRPRWTSWRAAARSSTTARPCGSPRTAGGGCARCSPAWAWPRRSPPTRPRATPPRWSPCWWRATRPGSPSRTSPPGSAGGSRRRRRASCWPPSKGARPPRAGSR